MNTFKRRDAIIAEFNAAAGHSFSVIYRALSELAYEQRSSLLDRSEVIARIRELTAATAIGNRRA